MGVRTKKTSAAADSLTRQEWPMAEKLHKAKLWSPNKRTTRALGKAPSLGPVESRRVNVVSDELCERHRGCDLFDINPGASLWSRALHDAVQPRRHIMMDPSARDYEALRKEVMGDRPNIEVIGESGIIWPELNKVLSSHLDPHHERVGNADKDKEPSQPQRNDMLLVTANLAMFPKKSLWNFDNVATMVLYQLMSSIPTSTLFQRYGSVRMLIWINDDIKRRVLPRSIVGRKRSAFEAELACEWIHEVAGSDVPDASTERLSLRDEWLHVESAARVLQRMEKQGITTPAGRETRMLQTVMADADLRSQPLSGHRPPKLLRPFRTELANMESGDDDTARNARDVKRLKALQYRDRHTSKEAENYLELIQLHGRLLHMDASTAEFQLASAEFDGRLEGMRKNQRNEFLLFRDNHHIFRHHGPRPALLWDRRDYEPLAIDTTDLYPNAPTCLLDIQPKSMDPVLRQYGPSSSRSGDYASLILRSLFNSTTHPIHTRAMDSVWPGFSDMAREHCPSLWAPNFGGSPMNGYGSLPVRCISETHWVELMRAWMRWPFRPSYHHMLGRSLEHDEDDDGSGGAGGGDVRGSASGSASS
ncbi:mitochondrial transcription factor 1 [Geosmithia morbida]|uniref:Mitochondrial transcription factor 1 n=1 Tax=Geosmithia morbida TaxID=1094350 RepID=A0A9P4Z0E1_9HYPO|nr:mitochondrial transcription factor 1 [Geosmithia morbida]KAF4126240.1 mitochondrial transcription factor 1 [Geosmithia morbida]